MYTETTYSERRTDGTPGVPVLFGGLVAIIVGIVLLIIAKPVTVLLGIVVLIVAVLGLRGLTQVAPGQARVVQLLGRYTGSIRRTGLRWVNPFTTRFRISTRIRNHQTEVTKVNDADGNPIEIAAVVVSLRDSTDEITQKLAEEIGARVASAGVTIVEARLSHLAYAPEIAKAMLRRQQANAVVAARQRIVEGAVGMVDMALSRLAEADTVDLDEERKAAMVSNLLVVLCADRDTQPVVNTGTLYH